MEGQRATTISVAPLLTIKHEKLTKNMTFMFVIDRQYGNWGSLKEMFDVVTYINERGIYISYFLCQLCAINPSKS